MTYPLAVQKIKTTMKQFISHFPITVVAVSLLIVAASLSGCSQNDPLPGDDNGDTRAALTVQVSDNGYSPAEETLPNTRATENDYTTEFTEGDKIGLYAVKDGVVVAGYENLCFTLTDDGSGNLSWMPPAGTTVWYEGASTKYFVYYPYRLMQEEERPPFLSASTDQQFFNSLITTWNPASDQREYVNYTSQDLMTGSGTVSDNGSARILSVALTHRMALVVLDLPRMRYRFTNKAPQIVDYITDVPDLVFTDFNPCCMDDGTYRYLINPVATSPQSSLLGSYTAAAGKTQEFTFTPKVSGGSYKTYKVDGGSKEITRTLQAGDFFMKDGTLLEKNVSLSAAQKTNCLGVIYYVADITQDDPLLKKDHPNCQHGLVVALQDAGGNSHWSSPGYEDITEKWLKNQNNKYDIATLKEEKKMQGYANTRALEGYNASDRVTGEKLGYKVLPIELIMEYAAAHPVPANCSDWYWPSLIELKYMCWGQGASSGTVGKAMLDEQLKKVNGALLSDRYWSCTECSNGDYAWRTHFFYGKGYEDSKDNTSCRVRAILTF